MGVFHNGLKSRHFNESLAQRPPSSLAKMVTREQCYIKGKESNANKKAWDIKQHVLNAEGSQHIIKSKYTLPIKDKTAFKRVGKAVESFTPLKTHCDLTWLEVFHLHNIHAPPSLKEYIMGLGLRRWCTFHKLKVHHTEYCYQLKKEIGQLIQEDTLNNMSKVTLPKMYEGTSLEVGVMQ